MLPVLVRAGIGTVLIAVLAWRADLSSVAASIGNVNFGYVTLAFLLILAAIVLGASRWRPYLRALGVGIPWSTSVRLALIGTFFNAFLPTGMGGDAYRALRVPRHAGSLSDAFASVVLDRAAGVVGMAVVALVSVSSGSLVDRGGSVPILALVTAQIVLLAYGAIVLLGRRRAAAPSGVASGGVVHRGLHFLATVARGAADPRASWQGIVVGIGTALLFVVANACLVRALHLSVPLGGLACLLLLASVVTVLPLSINGIGLREAVYVWGLGSFGVDGDPALAFALLVLATALASSAVGGIVYVAAGGRRPAIGEPEVSS